MEKRIYFKSDFDLTIQNAFDWTKPFKARFYTTASRHAKVVRFDGHRYHDCDITQDGKLHVAFDNFARYYGQGIGTLKITFIEFEDDGSFKKGFLAHAHPGEPVRILDDGGDLVEVKLSLLSDQAAPGVVAQLVTTETSNQQNL